MASMINLNPPLVLCFDLRPTDKFFRAVRSLKRKYPDVALATFDQESREITSNANDVLPIANFHFSCTPIDCISRHDVIGILCGSDATIAGCDRLKVMRC